MAARSVGSLFIDIEARTARLEADLAKTRGILARLNAQVGIVSKGFMQGFALAKGAVLAFASIAVVKSLEKMTMSTLQSVSAQMKLSEATGLGVNDLIAYSEASEHLGVSNLDMQKTMKELSNLQSDVRKGNSAAAQQIRQMGFSVEEFGALRPAQLFEGVVEGLNHIKDSSQRTALAQQVFGREAVNLTTLMFEGTGAIKNAREEMVRLGQTITSLDMAKVTVAMTAVAELDDRWQVFKKNLSIALAPLIFNGATNLANLLASIDVEKLANQIGKWVLAIVGFIITIPQRLKLMIKEVQLIWQNFVLSVTEGPAAPFVERMFGTAEEARAKADDIAAEIASLKTTIGEIGDEVQTEFDAKVTAIMESGKKIGSVMVGVTKTLSEASRELIQTFSSSMQGLTDVIADFVVDGEKKFSDFFRSVIKTMVSTMLKVTLINPLLNAAFGSMMGGGWSAGPAMSMPKAAGGPFQAGSSQLVGENGPEVATFSRAGYITPNDRLGNSGGGGMTINVNQNFQTGMTRAEFASASPTIIAQAKAAVADGVMRGGGYGRAVSGR